jgi:hypothetical protein
MEQANNNISMSAKVSEIIRDIISDGKEHERKEIVDRIIKETDEKEKLTSGIIAGAIKVFIERGELLSVRRGVYQADVSTNKTGTKLKVHRLMTKFQRDLEKICTVNVLQLSEEDIEFIKEIQEINSGLKNEISDTFARVNEKAVLPKDSPPTKTVAKK